MTDAEVALATLRAFIANELLDSMTAPAIIGDVTLHAHQREAVARLRRLLHLAGGALLADSTGLGKTFVALAIAHEFERVLIIAPASLAESWRQSMRRAGVEACLVSLQRLSRGGHSPLENPDLVIIDEAHHLRNSRAKRYAFVAALCDGARVLLLSATPLQNRRDDLLAQLALFLGDAALQATDAELSRFIVRRRIEAGALRLPNMHGPHWVELPIVDDLLDDLLAIPPPIAGADEGTASTLVTYTLLRQWSSSRAALVGALRRRIARAVAMMTSLEAGRWPTRRELAAWSYADQSIQLAFPEVLGSLGNAEIDLTSLLEAVGRHADALRALVARLRGIPDPDPLRAAALGNICRAHDGARVIAFSQYAETVGALSRLLMPRQGGVAALTATGGRVAGGRISRRDILSQFAPRAAAPEPHVAERIALLVTTDVLSEGLDLQRASVIVHLDLPWNPARLEQRVGRIRRLGSEHAAVFVYALAPPIGSERMLRVVERLQKKLGLAGRIVGLESTVIPSGPAAEPIAAPELASETHRLLESWRRTAAPARSTTAPLIAGVTAPNDGLVALLSIGTERLLVGAFDGDAPSSDPPVISRLLAMCMGPARMPRSPEIAPAIDHIRQWCCEWSARSRLAVSSPAGARLRAHIAARITSLLSAAPRHERAILARSASRAQQVLRTRLGIGAERKLIALGGAVSQDAAWLELIAALADGRESRSAAEPCILAILILRRSQGEDDGG